jgi:hypothetical protein
MLRRLRSHIVLLVCAVACSRDDVGLLQAPCPKPPYAAIPATDTVAVGDTVRFRVPAADLVHTPARTIRWSSTYTAVATIGALDGLAMARAVGLTEMYAVDQNTPANCPDVWHAALWVR